jgi:hypothetical protein
MKDILLNSSDYSLGVRYNPAAWSLCRSQLADVNILVGFHSFIL